MERVVVVGSSGAGKTTFARRLAQLTGLPTLEMDSVYHRDGWSSTPDEEFQHELEVFTRSDRWIVDGNYASHGSRDVVWPRADTFIWLDMPKRIVMRRVIARTLKRVITRETLWGNVCERWSNLYSLDPAKNIIVWSWTRFDRYQERYEGAIADGSFSHAEVVRLRDPRQVEAFLSELIWAPPDHAS